MEAPNNAQQYNMGPELQQVQRAWERIRVASPIYAFLLNDIDIYNAEKGVFHSRIQVAPHHLNSKGTLHGVFSACVTDWAGGLAIASHGLDSTGVSTDIHVNYLSTATTGDWLEIEGRANKVGKSLAFTSITISKRTETGQTTIVAHGTHTKYIRIR
ncbi:HotDog domain-containing protein [Aspergillus sergii]|uniref:HotDog domain-containing protein n=1 Tax=Aspergillus sergii TaxID=1034303 RepID=A0A5N6WJU2_9EURO|nr:HotDog domain-containing protein [Aspergillus sergii]